MFTELTWDISAKIPGVTLTQKATMFTFFRVVNEMISEYIVQACMKLKAKNKEVFSFGFFDSMRVG